MNVMPWIAVIVCGLAIASLIRQAWAVIFLSVGVLLLGIIEAFRNFVH